MIRIGVVGDIGAGKSFIAKQFGHPVFNADNEVSKLYKKNKKCFKKLKRAFPNYIFTFPIKKKELFRVIEENKNNIKKINKIVHLEVIFAMNKFLKKNKKKKAVVLDVPLLLENKIDNKEDIIVFVKSKKKEIKKRLKKRKNFNPKILEKLRKLQLPIERKIKKSDYILKNNFKDIYIKKNVKILKNKIFKND